jgi:16S rRNA (guanine527-N7)-methyltransferase
VTRVVDYLEAKTRRVMRRPLTSGETAKMLNYLNILIKWQKAQRLIGSGEPMWIVDNVIIDSLLFTRALPGGITKLADIGSGAGIPGIPLAVVLQDVDVTLIESRQKRASFLAAAIRELPLQNCRILNRRLEEAGEQAIGRFDAAVMRCAGNPMALLPQLRALVAPGGVVIASGPPRRIEVQAGVWLEVDGPDGTRTFWVYHVT